MAESWGDKIKRKLREKRALRKQRLELLSNLREYFRAGMTGEEL